MELKKGVKIICVDDGILPQHLLHITTEFPNWLQKGKEYTVRHVIIQQTPTEQIVSVLLEEIRNPEVWFHLLQIMHEPGFHINRFRVYKELPPLMMPNFSAN